MGNCGKETGPSTEALTPTTKTAPSPNPTTGRVLSSDLNHGSAEVPDSAREADGAPDMTVAKELPFPTKLQVSPRITEQHLTRKGQNEYSSNEKSSSSFRNGLTIL